jgi:hypothetical protein
MGKLKMGNLSRTSHNWKIVQDLLYVLPFTPVDRVVETYEEEILARIDSMKEEMELPFGSRAAEQKISNLCAHVERVWVGPRVGRRGRGRAMYSLLRWNHHHDCVTGDAVTNNSSEGTFNIGVFMIRIPFLYR